VLDVPAMFAHKGGGNVYWLGSRNAARYKLERSADKGKKWTVLNANLDADLIQLDNGVCAYVDTALVGGQDICYRVTAYDDEGRSAVSAPSNIREVFIPVELLQDCGFESGNIPNNSNSQGWYHYAGSAGDVTDEIFRSGNKSFELSFKGKNWGKTVQEVDVSPNASYSLSYWVNGSGVTYSVCVYGDNFDTLIAENWPSTTNGWVKRTRIFNSGDNSTLRICIKFGNTQTDVAYFDDFSLLENR